MSAQGKCYICKQERPCCGLSLYDLTLDDGSHCKHLLTLVTAGDPLAGTWRNGPMYRTCCGTVFGAYYDEEEKFQLILLGDCDAQALARIKHVESFL